MNDDLALIVAGSCIRAAREIGDLVRLIPNDRRDIKLGIASTVHEIHNNVIDIIFNDFPHLKVDMERRLKEYGRLI